MNLVNRNFEGVLVGNRYFLT